VGQSSWQPTQEGKSIVGLNDTPTVWNRNIEPATLAQAATDLSQVRVLLSSTPNMLNDMVRYDKVETLVWKREFGPVYLGELIAGTDPSFKFIC
jgi:hypothetical protein